MLTPREQLIGLIAERSNPSPASGWVAVSERHLPWIKRALYWALHYPAHGDTHQDTDRRDIEAAIAAIDDALALTPAEAAKGADREAEAIATFIGHECEVYDEPDAGGTPAQERDMAGGQPLGLAGAPAGDGAARPEDVRPAPTGVPPLVGGEGEPAGAKPGDVGVNPSPSPARGGEGNG